mgnify:CR=1 FL=1
MLTRAQTRRLLAERAKIDVESTLDTIKLGITPYTTPSEMDDWIQKVAAPAMDETLFGKVGQETRLIFRREATAKLRNYVVVDRTPQPEEEEILYEYKRRQNATAATLATTPERFPPGFYFRYVEPLQ